jgi:Zn-dependent peptidase ImmA (M78 family)
MKQVPLEMLRQEVAGKSPRAAATHLLTRLDVSTLPVDVERIAQSLGFRVERANIEPLALIDPAKLLIQIREGSSRVRDRYSVAHELGHALLHKPKPNEVMFRDQSFAPIDPIEMEANTFAAHLLMPLWLIEPVITSRKRTVTEWAKDFDVSPAALEWQVEHLSANGR